MKTFIFVVLTFLSLGASAKSYNVQCNDPIDGRVEYITEDIDSASVSDGSTYIYFTDGTIIMYPPTVACRVVVTK